MKLARLCNIESVEHSKRGSVGLGADEPRLSVELGFDKGLRVSKHRLRSHQPVENEPDEWPPRQ